MVTTSSHKLASKIRTQKKLPSEIKVWGDNGAAASLATHPTALTDQQLALWWVVVSFTSPKTWTPFTQDWARSPVTDNSLRFWLSHGWMWCFTLSRLFGHFMMFIHLRNHIKSVLLVSTGIKNTNYSLPTASTTPKHRHQLTDTQYQVSSIFLSSSSLTLSMSESAAIRGETSPMPLLQVILYGSAKGTPLWIGDHTCVLQPAEKC